MVVGCILCLVFSLLARLLWSHARVEPFAGGHGGAVCRHRWEVAGQDEGGHDEAVGVHHGHGDGPVVGQALL